VVVQLEQALSQAQTAVEQPAAVESSTAAHGLHQTRAESGRRER
jgi:hypothetical protein